MTKAELVAQIASKTNFTKAASEKFLVAMLEAVQDTLITEGKVSLAGSGAVTVEERKARKGRNPRTGETIAIEAAKVVKFRPGKTLKETIL